MVWTVETSDGAEERRGTGEDSGGILRPSSLSSCFVCSALPHHMKEEDEDTAGMMAERRGAALLLVAGRSAAMCGDVVAIASPRSGRCGRPSLSLSDGTIG